MLVLAGILCVTPAVGFVSNLVLCKLFPMWGNYITAGLAAGAGALVVKCTADTNEPITKSLETLTRCGFGLLLGCSITAMLAWPVAVKVVIAIFVKIGSVLASYSDT